MEANVDELELHEEHLESGEGNGWLGEGEGEVVFLYRKIISPGWYRQPGLKGGSLVPVGNTNQN
jgi:hypothetical protein